MYTSLDRIDIVTKTKDTGRLGYVQTDHRSPAEIESEPELAVLFALTRVLAAGHMGEREGGAEVTYTCVAPPPDFLREAVASAGGSVAVNQEALEPPARPRPVADLADAAFRGLAERTRARYGGALDEGLLVRLEDATLQALPDREEDEGAYWTRLHELAAVCGELLREKTGGRWAEADDRESVLPFAFKAGDAAVFVADKAQRLLDEGESQRPSFLLRLAEDLHHDPEEGPLFVVLKPGDFPRQDKAWRPLLEGSGPGGASLPAVFLGRDQPHSFGYLATGSPEAAGGFEAALANLARLDLPVEEHEIAGVKVLSVSNHFYAAEKILDQAFLRRLHRRLGAELLAAAVPYKGLLLVTKEVAPPTVVAFALMAEKLFQESAGAPPLCPVAFLVADGKVVGHLDPSHQEPEPGPRGRKGLLGRLLGH